MITINPYSVQGSDGTTVTFNLVHLYYEKEALREEVEKRTSYLGRFRSREDASHLLELIAFTKDEQDLYDSYVKEAMADVFDKINSGSTSIQKSCEYADYVNGDSVVGINYYLYYPTENNLMMANALDISVQEALVYRIIWKWLLLAYPDECKNFDTLYNDAVGTLENRLTMLNRTGGIGSGVAGSEPTADQLANTGSGSIVNKTPRPF